MIRPVLPPSLSSLDSSTTGVEDSVSLDSSLEGSSEGSSDSSAGSEESSGCSLPVLGVKNTTASSAAVSFSKS